ncbi:ATP-dependent Zn proteases [Fulvimarina manganoxydans]|uniref:ATP-dependent Zn proteases n=1 Tax=Fulvimarina manganoxydans TaxID=937218 RepID=A0A1W1Y7X4_9HYPH|nr:AAA family ATPase [Fulvimarina manganoxydans]SMC32234.1 ATP-dependent Zn proteases [Fulvimarina manganoxydans]
MAKNLRLLGGGRDDAPDALILDDIHDLASDILHADEDDDDDPDPGPDLRPSQRVARIVLERSGLMHAFRDRIVLGVPGVWLVECGADGWTNTVIRTIGKSLHLSFDHYQWGRGFDLSLLARAADLGRHIIMTRDDDDDPFDDEIRLFALAEFDLRDDRHEDVAQIVSDHFGRQIDWPADLPARRMPYHALDYALVYGADEAAAERLVRVQIAVEERKRAESAIRRVEEQEKEAARNASRRGSGGKVDILRPTSPRVEDLAGYGDAARWAADLVADIAAYRAGEIAWSEVDTGALLVGPPGTGKTLFASALAASCDLPMISSSFAQWAATGASYQSDTIRAMRQTFEAAAANIPLLLFIDEIDSLPRRGVSPRHDDYWRPIVNTALECFDGTLRTEGIVVIAACNDASGLDPALLRSGRLDRRFEIALPDAAALARIFAHHAPDLPSSAIEPVATALAGTASGADVARFAREAKRIARRERRTVSGADILKVALPAETRTRELVLRTAIHEAGHAIALMLSGHVPRALSIVVDSLSAGHVSFDVDSTAGRLADVYRIALPALAGRAAEDVLLGEPTIGAAGDLETASGLVAGLDRGGLGGFLTPAQPDGDRVEARMRRLYAEAVMLVIRNRGAIMELAHLAVERRVLGEAALREFATKRGLA